MERSNIKIITWGNEIRRSESLSKELNGQNIWIKRVSKNKFINYFIYYIKSIKYILSQKLPINYILVAPPTIIFYLIPFIKFSHKKNKIIIDCHNGVIRSEWRHLPFIAKLINKADVVVSHNVTIKQKIDDIFNCESVVLSDPLIRSPKESRETPLFIKEDKINVFFPVSYAKDEPIELILMVGNELSKTHNFILSGNYKKYFKERELPDNISFTGFISKEDYFSYIGKSDIVGCLTKDNDIQMCAIIESISYRKKIVCTDSIVNRTLFKEIPLTYTSLNEESLKNSILESIGKSEPSESDLNSYVTKWNNVKSKIFRE